MLRLNIFIQEYGKKYGENELICNYWKFLDDEEQQILESQLLEDDNESEIDYGDYDSEDEMYKIR